MPMMSLLQDIAREAAEYLPFLLIISIFGAIWIGLCLSAGLACWSIRRYRIAPSKKLLLLMVVPLLLGTLGTLAEIPFSYEEVGRKVFIDLGWFFLVPALLGASGVVRWWHAAHLRPT